MSETVKTKVVLPTTKVKAARKDPRVLILYGPPKVGKTTLLSNLDGCLILDLEEGTGLIDALKIDIENLKHLHTVGEEIKAQGKPYKYVAIDTITKLEAWCESAAKVLYKKTPMGKNFDGDSVLSLPNGAGYLYLRQAFLQYIEYLYTLADRVILVGHLKDKFIEKEGKEVQAKDLDLTGKIRSITCANADAVGYLYRDGEGISINFKSSDEVTCGSRCDHLKGQDFKFDWSKIYID